MQLEESLRKSAFLENEICEVMSRLCAREQELLRLEMCLGMQGCSPAVETPSEMLTSTDVRFWPFPAAPLHGAILHAGSLG